MMVALAGSTGEEQGQWTASWFNLGNTEERTREYPGKVRYRGGRWIHRAEVLWRGKPEGRD